MPPIKSTPSSTPSPAPDSDPFDPADSQGPDAPFDLSASPLHAQIWQRFCDGKSIAGVARGLGIDRQTAARHIHAIQDELADSDREFYRLALLQAVQSQLAIQVAAMDAYRAEVAAEEDYRAACAYVQATAERAAATTSHVHPRIHPDWLDPAERAARAAAAVSASNTPPPFRAQRARLLTVASNAAWRAALLQGLVPRSGPLPASASPASPTDPTDPTDPTTPPLPDLRPPAAPPPLAPGQGPSAPFPSAAPVPPHPLSAALATSPAADTPPAPRAAPASALALPKPTNSSDSFARVSYTRIGLQAAPAECHQFAPLPAPKSAPRTVRPLSIQLQRALGLPTPQNHLWYSAACSLPDRPILAYRPSAR